MKKVSHSLFGIYLLLASGVGLLVSQTVSAASFKIGETILVGFPAANIKDDAYIIGIIRKVTDKGDYQISVSDYVEGHDYGLSCVPISVDSTGKETGLSGWDLWGDTKTLSNNGLNYIVPAKNAVKLGVGKMNFIDRYNIYITYSRWKSNVPVMSVERIETAEAEASYAGMNELLPALAIAKLDRSSYYDPDNSRPYWPYESVPRLTKLLAHIQSVLESDAELNRMWRAKKRDWMQIEQSMKTYFLIDSIDKAVTDAHYILNEDDLDKADPKSLKQLKTQLNALGKKV